MTFRNRYVIVYNGEIYNFRDIRDELGELPDAPWRSSSDTEVIMAAYDRWGPECLKRFHGMFAFAIWDREKKEFFAARDRMGEKPFYYCDSDDTFLFASRPHSLFALDPSLPQTLDEAAIRTYLEAGYVPAPMSIFRKIRKLPPAHFLLVSASGTTLSRYWDFRNIAPEASWEHRREDDLLDELDELVSRSVKLRMVSDAPIGAFLSGGIDSSLIVAKMVQHSSIRPVSLTIGLDDVALDESKYAQAVALHLNTQHHCETMRVNDLLGLMEVYFSEFDEPCFDYSAFPTMAVSRLARQLVTVSLCGDGGDELFGGYHYYRIIDALASAYRLPNTLRKGLAGIVGSLPGNSMQLLGGALRKSGTIEAFAFSRSIVKDYSLPFEKGLDERTASLSQRFIDATSEFPPGLTDAEQAMRLDLQFTLPDDYLHKVDRSSMAFSLESREPLLDQDLVEWSLRLPVKWKLRNGTNKYLLRKLLYRHVPASLVDRPKMGFGVPMADWLRGPLKTWVTDRIHSAACFQDLPIDQTKVLALYALHCSGKRNVAPLLWAILVLLEHQRVLRNLTKPE